MPAGQVAHRSRRSRVNARRRSAFPVETHKITCSERLLYERVCDGTQDQHCTATVSLMQSHQAGYGESWKPEMAPNDSTSLSRRKEFTFSTVYMDGGNSWQVRHLAKILQRCRRLPFCLPLLMTYDWVRGSTRLCYMRYLVS